MKKKSIIIAGIIAFFALGAAIWFLGGKTVSMKMEMDYRCIYPEDLYKNADLVISGRYLRDTEVYGQEGTGTPQTVGTVQVETVYKGEVQGDTIPIRFTGGTISLREYVAKRPADSLEKQGLSGIVSTLVMARLGSKITVAFDTAVNAQAQQKYLLFLSYDEEEGVYQVLSDAYGMRPLNAEGEAYDPMTKAYRAVPSFVK